MIKTIYFSVICLALSLCSLQTTAQLSNHYQKELDRTVQLNRAIVAFQANTSLADINTALEGTGASFQYQVPWPCITYITLNPPAKNYADLLQILANIQQKQNVQFANPILETIDHSGYGVLNEAIVKLKPNTTYQQLVKLAAEYKVDIKEKYAYIDNAYILTFSKQSMGNALDVSLALKGTGLFQYAEPNYILNPLVATNDQYFYRQWSIKNDSTTVIGGGLHGTLRSDMRIDSAWTISTGDSTIKIAVIDAGVDTAHPDLQGQLLPGYDATGHGSKGYPNIDKGENAHGTSCTGIIVAKADDSIGIAGIAHSCKVMPIRVFYYIDTSLGGAPLPNTPWSTALWMADAIGYAWHTGNVDVMSNSWGVPDILFSQIGDSNNINAVTDIVNEAATQGRGGKGIPILFSSGNYDPSTPFIPVTPIWPGRLEAAISVNATSMCDEPKSLVSCDHEQWIGCYGDNLDISAPGVRVTTCDMSGNLGYSNSDYTFTFNGTSAACPNAAGVMALILSERPDVTLDGAKYLLFASADTIFSVDTNRYSAIKQFGPWSPHLGYGRVNAYRALLMAQTFNGIDMPNNNAGNANITVFPNPANSNQINIRYQVAQNGNVTINIYNIDGQLVKTEEKGNHAVGQYQEPLFNGPTILPTGMYIGKISFGAHQNPETFRFVIAK